MIADKKLLNYYIISLISLIFAVVGFSYNAWRLEVSEENNNIRTASFEVIKTLADFEQLIYAAHYDKDPVKGNPRTGWVQVGLVNDLSVLIDASVLNESQKLKKVWKKYWEIMPENVLAKDEIIKSIDALRSKIQKVLGTLS